MKKINKQAKNSKITLFCTLVSVSFFNIFVVGISICFIEVLGMEANGLDMCFAIKLHL